MILASLRAYILAVLRRWSFVVGSVAAVLGYLVNLFTDLKITPLAWAGVYLAGLIVAQFLVYHEQRLRLQAYAARVPLPQWAMWAHNANSDGAWLTLMAVSRPPKKALGSTDYEELAKAAARHFGFDDDSLGVEPFANFLRVKFPDTNGTPEFLMQVGIDSSGIVVLQWRTIADPIPLRWILERADLAISFTLTEWGCRVLGNPRKRDYSVSLSNWPAGGVSIDGLLQARRISCPHVRGYQVRKDFKLIHRDRDGWKALLAFATTIVSDSGYVGFEPSLTALTRDQLRAPATPQLPDSEEGSSVYSGPGANGAGS